MTPGTGFIELIIFARRVNGELVFVKPFDFIWNFRAEEAVIKDTLTNNISVIDMKTADVFNGIYNGAIVYKCGKQEDSRECWGTNLVAYSHGTLRESFEAAKANAEKEKERYIFAMGDEAFTKTLIPFASFIRLIELPKAQGSFVQYLESSGKIELDDDWKTIISTAIPHSYLEDTVLRYKRLSRDNVKSYSEIPDHATL